MHSSTAPRLGHLPHLRGALLTASLLVSGAMPAQAIVGGTATESFSAVGAGVQLTADWVLTAAHLAFSPGQTYNNGYGVRTVEAVYRAPDSDITPGNDLHLLRLAPLAPGGVIAPLLPVSSYFVPYGSFAAEAATITSANGRIYTARGFAFTTMDESLQSAEPDIGGPPVTVNWLISHDAGFYVESGDSGGGLFEGHVSDSSLLLGITSAQIDDGAGTPTGSTFVQPAAYRSWIDATLVADATDSQAILWQAPVPVPEPASVLLFAAGAAGLAGVLRGRRRPGSAGEPARQPS